MKALFYIILVLFIGSWIFYLVQTNAYKNGYEDGRRVGYKEGLEEMNKIHMTIELNRLRNAKQ